VSEEAERDEIISYITKRIEELRRELAILEALLRIVKGGSSEVEERKHTRGSRPTSVKVISVGGNVVADIVESGDGVKIVFTETIPSNNPVVKSFLIKLLQDKERKGEIRAYEVHERRGFITSIEIKGVPKRSFYRELELALEYVWEELHGGKH